jgi:hypothetical protein
VEKLKNIFITLNVSESKRLIAKGVVQDNNIHNALQSGLIIIAGGTTNAYIYEELTGETLDDKGRYPAGVIHGGRACVTASGTRIPYKVLAEGNEIDEDWKNVMKDFDKDDVFIKGGNALDYEGNVGILLADNKAGTIGKALPVLNARGSKLIIPVGLEKLIYSVPKAANLMGIDALDRGMGKKVGMMNINYGSVYTEIEALKNLAAIEVVHASSGGVSGSEGSQSFLIKGAEIEVDKVIEILKDIKGEESLYIENIDCPCQEPCLFPYK